MVIFVQILKNQDRCLVEDDIVEFSSLVYPEDTGIEFTAQCAGQV